MDIIGNTMLITGGGSGIGRGLAEAFHKLGNLIVITGREQTSVPTFCATKAGLHSYLQSLRYQLKGMTTDVVEVIPSYVQTDLGPSHTTDRRAMPLAEFIAELMTILRVQTHMTEVVVERC